MEGNGIAILEKGRREIKVRRRHRTEEKVRGMKAPVEF
jgi:hypothetical protein